MPKDIVMNSPSVHAIPVLDLDRYAGLWHEIAAYPLFFERGCGSHVTALYSWKHRPTGISDLNHAKLVVDNQCAMSMSKESKTGSGASASVAKSMESVGSAVPDKGCILSVDAESGHLLLAPAKLSVSFFPFVEAPYWVIELEETYRWAVVSHPTRKYLWILSRTDALEESVLEDILARLVRNHGFDLVTLRQKLIFRQP